MISHFFTRPDIVGVHFPFEDYSDRTLELQRLVGDCPYKIYSFEMVYIGDIVVLTDRNDLDDQLYGQFVKCKEFLRQEPVHAESREHLKSWLAGRQANGIIFTTMQKFEESFDALSERRNIVVMADEAHRGQYGLAEKIKITKNEDGEEVAKRVVGIARIIRNSLPTNRINIKTVDYIQRN